MFGKKKIIRFKAEKANIPYIMDWILNTLGEFEVSSDDKTRMLLRFEDVLATMIDKSFSDAYIKIEISKKLGSVELNASCRGSKFDIDVMNEEIAKGFENNEYREELLNFMSKFIKSDISIAHRGESNFVSLAVAVSSHSMLYMILIALFASIIFGIVAKNVFPESFNGIIVDYLLGPVNTMFMNALKLLISPLIFFSIAKSIADYSDLRSLGRVAFKVTSGYIFTSIVAIGIGFLLYYVFPIGDSELAKAVTTSEYAQKASTTTVSIKDTIVNIIPTNIVAPFINMDMLAIIFMGLLIGCATSLLQNTHPACARFVLNANELFTKATSIVMKLMPVIVFTSIANMIISCSVDSTYSLLKLLLVICFGCVVMMCFYMVMLTIIGRLNPLNILSKIMPIIVTAFSTASSAITMPVTLKTCRDRLGIHSRICSFSIPFGATINMDGNSIFLAFTGMFMASSFGIEVSLDMFVSMVIMILALSMGQPGVPGGCLISMAILCQVINVPPEAVSLLIVVNVLSDPIVTTNNVLGDVIITTLVAKSENALDVK